jgi:hypothetical protein
VASKHKQKGTAAETAVVRWLQANGHPYAERRTLSGQYDRGDIAGVPGICIEVKNHARWDAATWLAEAITEAENAGVDIGIVVAKKRGTTNPGDWYVITTLDMFNRLIADAEDQ